MNTLLDIMGISELAITVFTYSYYDDICSILNINKKIYTRLCDDNIWYTIAKNKWNIDKSIFLTNHYYPVEFPKSIRLRYAQIATINGEANKLSINYVTPSRLLINAIRDNNSKYIQQSIEHGVCINKEHLYYAGKYTNRDFISYYTNNIFDGGSYSSIHELIIGSIASHNLPFIKTNINRYWEKYHKFVDKNNVLQLMIEAYKTNDDNIIQYIETLLDFSNYPLNSNIISRSGLLIPLYKNKRFDIIDRLTSHMLDFNVEDRAKYIALTRDKEMIYNVFDILRDNGKFGKDMWNLLLGAIDTNDLSTIQYVEELIEPYTDRNDLNSNAIDFHLYKYGDYNTHKYITQKYGKRGLVYIFTKYIRNSPDYLSTLDLINILNELQLNKTLTPLSRVPLTPLALQEPQMVVVSSLYDIIGDTYLYTYLKHNLSIPGYITKECTKQISYI